MKMRTLLTALFMALATQAWSDNLLKLDSFICGPSVDQLTPILIKKDNNEYVDLVSGSPVSQISNQIFLFDTVAAEQKWLVYEGEKWLLRQLNAGKIQYEYDCVIADKSVSVLQETLMSSLLPEAEDKIFSLKTSLSERETELLEALVETTKLGVIADVLRGQNNEFLNQNSSMSKQIENLKQSVNENQLKNEALLSANDELLKRLSNMEKEKKDLLSNHERELQRLASQNAANHAAITAKYRSAINEKNRLSGEIKSLREKIMTLEAAIAGKPVKCSNSSDIQLQNLGNRLNAALARAATEERKRRELEQKCVFIAE